MGADAVLLIAAALEPSKLQTLAKFAKTLQLEILLEVHNNKELQDNLTADVDLIGVNNRDLKTFDTDIEISKQLADKIPNQFVKVSESGIENPATIIELKKFGFEGFLMGQNFMQHSRPEKACRDFITELKRLEK
jgi:indole-3-glycerol phosphate synthase